MTTKKYLYCDVGEHYPDEIVEMHDYAASMLKWDEEKKDYEKEDTVDKYGDSTLLCREHEVELDEKAQEETKEAPDAKGKVQD